MALPIRIVNAFFAALFLVALLVSLGFLAAAFDGLAREPAGLWIASGWTAAMAACAVLCFANLRLAGGERKPPLIAANFAALLASAAGLLAPDPAVQWICGVSAIPFAATGLALILRQRLA